MQEKSLETEPCKWFRGAIQLMRYVNRYPVGQFADYTDLEYLDYRKWVGTSRTIGELDLRPNACDFIIVNMGAYHEENWVNTFTLSFLKYCLYSVTDGFDGPYHYIDGQYPIENWVSAKRVTCLQDPQIAEWVVCAVGCIGASFKDDNEFDELRRLITKSIS